MNFIAGQYISTESQMKGFCEQETDYGYICSVHTQCSTLFRRGMGEDFEMVKVGVMWYLQKDSWIFLSLSFTSSEGSMWTVDKPEGWEMVKAKLYKLELTKLLWVFLLLRDESNDNVMSMEANDSQL